MSNTCSNCKYWGDGRSVQPDKHNICGMIEMDETPSRDSAFIEVQVADDTNLNVEFKTLANFGCSLHSPRINSLVN